MVEITVDLGPRAYPVRVGRGLADRLSAAVPPPRGRPVALVASARVWGLHRPRLAAAVRGLAPRVRVLLADGERQKSRETLAHVHDAFARTGLTRDAVVLAVGGGVVGDLAGFAAATYMRGVDWVVVPTTLLAMVDSAIGGKTGINHPQAKNLIGAFHQPRAVVSDLAFLDTLPRRERQSGAYEVLKCAILADPGLFESLLREPGALVSGDGRLLERGIVSSCRVKADVVARDEREGGRRRVLNLGHTLGHALESVTRYRRFTHGEAVGWGLLGAAALARRRGLLEGAAHDAIVRAVDGLGPRPRISDLRPVAIREAIARDKKASAGRLVFVLPSAVGRVEVHDDVRPREVDAVLRDLTRMETRRR